jgi:outer membrane protein
MENNNTLAKVSLAINAILIVLVIVIFTKLPSTSSESDESVLAMNDSTVVEDLGFSPTNKIGFFNLDSLNAQLGLFKEIEVEIQNASKSAENKMKKKQAEIDNWKNKWEKKGKLLSSEIPVYEQEAMEIQNDAMQFEQNVQMKLMQEQEELMQTYALRLSNYTKDYAKENGYDMIQAYQFGQSLWYYNPQLDITADLAKVMNDDYNSSSAVSEETE